MKSYESKVLPSADSEVGRAKNIYRCLWFVSIGCVFAGNYSLLESEAVRNVQSAVVC